MSEVNSSHKQAVNCFGDYYVVHVFVKSYVSSDKLEGSFVVHSVDMLFIECIYGVWFCFLE